MGSFTHPKNRDYGDKTRIDLNQSYQVAYWKERFGISQEELGFRADVHRTYISQLERGLKSPTLNMILRLSRALKASASKLVATVERQLQQ